MANLGIEIKHGVKLTVKECPVCGTVYAISTVLDRQCAKSGKDWYCPNGHSLIYTVSEVDKLKEQLAKAKENEEFWRKLSGEAESELRQERKQHASTKGQLTKTKKRHAAGVCPCCNRQFVQLARHMQTKHPSYKVED